MTVVTIILTVGDGTENTVTIVATVTGKVKNAKLALFTSSATHPPSPMVHSQMYHRMAEWIAKICSASGRQHWSKRCAEMLAVTPYFEDFGTTYKPKKTAKAVATAAYPLGERNALLMRSVKSAFALLLTKVTKPAAEWRKEC